MPDRNTPPPTGLSPEQVAERIRTGRVNTQPIKNTKSASDIFKDNLLTLFNLFNLVIALLILWVGAYKNLTFLFVILSNILIGIVQEFRSKHAVEKLSVISMPRAHVMRSGKEEEIDIESLVMDDVTVLVSGRQVCADSLLLEGELEVNESLLTGESDPVVKKPGDSLLSGSYVISGTGYARVEHVGAENYAVRIALEAQKHKKLHSGLMDALDRIVRFTGFFIGPLGIALFLQARFGVGASVADAVVSTAAALLGMLPKGLVLLTSVSLMVGVIKLAGRRTLVQELFCIETLSRVDTLCLDKTGTITRGEMAVSALHEVPCPALPLPVRDALCAFTAAMEDNNATFLALRAAYPPTPGNTRIARIPFSSERKYSAASLEGIGTLAVGAPEILCPGYAALLPAEAACAARDGARLLLAAYAPAPIDGGLPAGLSPFALLVLTDPIRDDAADTLAFFRSQDVQPKIISGDNPLALSQIAAKVGFEGAAQYVDASVLSDEELIASAGTHHIFGRVTPRQKRLLVRALKDAGHTVAMTGDGVNDVLALKDADCSVAMASGSDAARQVAQLVLLDSQFSSLPHVVMEGRRVVNNITRTASLFLVKTVFSFLLSFLTLLLGMPYPFIPIQLTLLGTLCEGIPAFFLALEPNTNRIRGAFLPQVLYHALPTAIIITAVTVAANYLSAPLGWDAAAVSTLCVLAAGVAWLLQLGWICRPFNILRTAVWTAMAIGFVGSAVFFPGFFSLTPLPTSAWIALAAASALIPLATWLLARLLRTIPWFRQALEAR